MMHPAFWVAAAGVGLISPSFTSKEGEYLMRAKIAGVVVLTGFMALSTSFIPTETAVSPEEGVRPMTQSEMDCAVGGKAGCLDEGMYTWVECMIDEGIDVSSSDSMYDNGGAVASCFVLGARSALVCTFNSFLDWLF
jgi:hypothetical protein